MATHRSLRPSLVLFSLLLTAILALGSAFLLRNTALRWYYLHQLRSPHATQRLEAMAYVCGALSCAPPTDDAAVLKKTVLSFR